MGKNGRQPHHQQKEIEMDTSPNATSNADIELKLNKIVDDHLFTSTSWPMADDDVRAFWRTVEEMGL